MRELPVLRANATSANAKSLLKFIFLKRLERRRAGAQGIVFGDTVEDVDAAVVQKRGLRDRAFGGGGTEVAALEWFGGDFLDRFEAVAFDAFVFVKRHDRSLLLSY